jgi:hypothetical protein
MSSRKKGSEFSPSLRGPPSKLQLIGLIALSDPRSWSALRSAITQPVTAETAATKMGLSLYVTA